MNRLDPLQLPVDGIRLIEASAGTGKTHAIATLYLRLVLGVRGEAPRRVQEILVVTFTRAATEELRGRVRNRLYEALDLLSRVQRGERDVLDASGKAADPQLKELLALVVSEGRTEESIIRLRLELATIDDAAIYTIHGFCQRALQEQAFDSGEAFDVDLVQDDSLRELQAVQDHWRSRFYGSDLLAAFVRAHYGTPENLHAKLRPLLRPGQHLQYAGIDADALQARRTALAAAWRDGRDTLLAAIHACKGLSRGPYKPADVAQVAADVDAWLATDALAPPGMLKLFGRRSLDESLTATGRRNGDRVPDTGLDAVVQSFLDGIPALGQQVLAEAARDIGARLEAARRHAGAAAFDDLIGRLHGALNDSPQGARLAAALRRRYPVALIDEFQDTDPLQYSIFSRIYGGGGDGALLMIGDPKQAIYSFRGADIFAYMQARTDAGAARRYSLDTNWRSVTPMVDGVNALFARRNPAFLFGDAIEFHPVKAAGGADDKRLQEDGQPPVPIEFWALPAGDKGKPLGKGVAGDLTLEQTARRIAALLQSGTREGKPLKPRDIAVLVRTNAQGSDVQGALRGVGIGSAMTAADSVFASDEAAALRDVLAAIAEPANDRALRRALVSSLWLHDAKFIAGLADNGPVYEALLRSLQDWRDSWLARGFMPMFRDFLHRAGDDNGGAATRLLARPDGERRLTNLIQLGELLQQASREHPTPEALLRWLDDNIAEPDANAEEQQLRLESDEDLVQILTLHRSKGLEYPVVFLPFLYHTIAVDPERGAPRFHDEAGRLIVDLAASDESVARADYERLAEDLRLLYVALTRAKDYCVVPWGRVNATETSALAYLLHGPDSPADVGALATHMKGLDAAAVQQQLDALAASHPHSIRVVDINHAVPAASQATPAVATGIPPAALAARPVTRRVQRAWIATSYSGLVEGSHEDARDIGSRQEAAPAPAAASSPALTPFSLPGGTETGHLFHDLFETIDYRDRDPQNLQRQVAAQLARRAMPADWCDTVATMITNTLDAALDDSGFTLRQLDGKRRRNELEFWFPLNELRADALEKLLPGLGDGINGPRLSFAPVNGLLQGFIDLVYEHGGRWYVLDWKTNKLGPDASHYTHEHLARAVAQHRYDLQYTLYTLALHRHLQRALGGRYDPAQHLGGVHYLFLRGLQPDNPVRPGVWHVPADIARIVALDALCRGRSA